MKKRTNFRTMMRKVPAELRPAWNHITAKREWPTALAYPQAYAKKLADAVKSREGLSRRLITAAISWRRQEQQALLVKPMRGAPVPAPSAAGIALVTIELPTVAVHALDVIARKRGKTREQVAALLIMELCRG